MITETDVINIALSRLSLAPIGSLDEATDRAKAVRPVWPVVLHSVLTAHDWSFAAKTAPGARIAIAADDPLPLPYAYAYPEDCAKVRNVTLPDPVLLPGRARVERPQARYVVERYADTRRQAIFADAPEVMLEYTSDRTLLDDFTPDALDALIGKLATEIALKLGNSTQRANELLQQYQMSIAFAKGNETKSQSAKPMNGHDYTNARGW